MRFLCLEVMRRRGAFRPFIKVIAAPFVVVCLFVHVTLNHRLLSGGDDALVRPPLDSFIERSKPQSVTASSTHIVMRHLKLRVPFYVYKESNLNWENHTFIPNDQTDYSKSKHSDDYWLYQASLRHPMRTHDPDRAALFFVPFFLNAISERKTCIQLNSTTERCFRRPGHAFRYANDQLSLSKYFQRSQGRDHVIVISHWLTPLTKKINNLLNCNLVNFEGHIPVPSDGVSFIPSLYVGRGCDSEPRKTHDFVLVATVRPLPEFRDRETICQWLRDGKHSVSACGQGDQCPAVAQAKYGFHPRGDTLGSNRVIDLVLSRTVPLFTNPAQYDILPNFVPWRKLSYLVNVSTKDCFEESVAYVLSRPESEYQEKLRWIDEYMHFFDHSQIYQFDAYMTEFAKRRKLQ